VAKNLRQRERGIMLKLNEYDPFPKKWRDILLKTQGGRSNIFFLYIRRYNEGGKSLVIPSFIFFPLRVVTFFSLTGGATIMCTFFELIVVSYNEYGSKHYNK
jgi:hypothetical protein